MRATIPAIALTALILTSGAGAAPLCRGSKGLFTPCIGAPARPAHAARPMGEAAAARARLDTPASTASARTVSARPAKPSIFVRGKLCRDTKGLFKPC